MKTNTEKEIPSDLKDIFAIKNFVLFDDESIPPNLSLTNSLIFNGFVFGICIKGKGVVKINFKEYEISENTILSILPNHIFKTESKTDDFFVEILFLSLDFLAELPMPTDYDLLLKMGKNPSMIVTKEEMHNLLELHSIIVKYHKQAGKYHNEQTVKALIFALIMETGSIYMQYANKETHAKIPTRQEELTDKFFKLLANNFKNERSVSFYADKLFLTPKYLSAMIKNTTGYSILYWINNGIIIESQRILKTTTLSILEVSEELNFPNPSFFIRFFKQHTGVTPLKYRNG